MPTVLMILVVFIAIIGLNSNAGRVWFLHMRHEVGTEPSKRIQVARRMFELARDIPAVDKTGHKDARHSSLHKAFDVICHEGHIQNLEPGSEFHKEFWQVGHDIVVEILKRQPYINIDQIWLVDDYEQVVALSRSKLR